MTDEQIKELLVLCAKATPDPVIVHRYEHGGGRIFREESRELIIDAYKEGDREFYVASRTALPEALAELQERRTTVEVGNYFESGDGYFNATHENCLQFVFVSGQPPSFCPHCGKELLWK